MIASRIPAPDGDDVLFGVFVGDELSGCAGFARQKHMKGRHKALMWGVYLRPSLRGRGLGEALVDKVIEHARSRVELVKCVVNPESPGARRLYLGRGFKTYGREPRALRTGGRDQDDELLALILKDLRTDRGQRRAIRFTLCGLGATPTSPGRGLRLIKAPANSAA